jgi:prepilin signal peptidase PulO-like enzyme (type II secretory pathway)
VNFVLAIPLAVRLVVLFVVGTLAGAAVNRAVCRVPQPALRSAPHRTFLRRAIECLPLVRWLALARAPRGASPGSWLRPLAVELAAGAAFAALYVWETRHAPLLVFQVAAAPGTNFFTDNLPLVAHARYVSHVVLLTLMFAASLVDLDEKTIPDSITVPGTLVALVFAIAYPWSLLPSSGLVLAARLHVDFLTLASPHNWQLSLTTSLAVALGCWTLWCGGLLPRYWNARRGWSVACRVFLHRLRVERSTYAVLAMWIVGAAAITLAARFAVEANWAALVTALVGMAAGGFVIWIVRIVGGAVLAREAMGFGDVTLMSMIGAFLGWQASLAVFFVAPFFGLAFAIVTWIARREREIPYGPFLCAAALVVILQWPAFWDRMTAVFILGWIAPALAAGSLVLLGVLLGIYRLLGSFITRAC